MAIFKSFKFLIIQANGRHYKILGAKLDIAKPSPVNGSRILRSKIQDH